MSACYGTPKRGRVASSAVEHPAFNRLVLSSNLRRPIQILVIDPGCCQPMPSAPVAAPSGQQTAKRNDGTLQLMLRSTDPLL